MRSLKGFEWTTPAAEASEISRYALGLGLSEFLARALISRGIEFERVADFLNPSLRGSLPDPYVLVDTRRAVERFYAALTRGEKIVVYGDYDVDGATASALLRRYIRDIGESSDLYIPDRLDEGYGANAAALEELAVKGFGLCLMVDCGTTAFDALAAAERAGLDVIVLDHHAAEATLPRAVAIVNPNRKDQDLGLRSDLKHLCAAGVAFFFVVALNRYLREKGYFQTTPEPDLLKYLDLVALGTVCDVMPLRGINRAFVAQGLKVAKKRANVGLAALADAANLNDGIASAYHFGFVLGPRINACGRVGQADLGSRLLYTDDFSRAREIALKLNEYNSERQAVEEAVTSEALALIEANGLNERAALMVKGKDWHPGVIGIVAGRLKERFDKPVLVATDWRNETKGSARSVAGLDMGAMAHLATREGLLSKGGGHAMAAGFTVMPGMYEAFYDFVENFARPILAGRTPTFNIDGFMSLDGLNFEFVRELARLEPYGAGHPTPVIAVKNLKMAFSDTVGKGHIRFVFRDETNKRIDAIAFRSVGTPLEILRSHKGTFSVAGSLKADTYRGGSRVQLIVEDAVLD